jgi:prepilin-type processing-associated H-X9-DG protein/prepilin-type N-terminal cleavage/methylation domain-containing protein
MKRGREHLCTTTKDGFSLLELLLVVAILVTLTTLYWGGTSGNTRRREQQAACQHNLERIFMAMEIYANDSGGKFPVVPGARNPGEVLSLLVPRYTVDTAVFICPASKDLPLPEGEPFKQHTISYAYYMGRYATNAEALMSDRQVDALAKVPGQNVFSSNGKPPGNNHEKSGNFLFCDGHVEETRASAPFALGLGAGVVLLNP